MFLSFFSNAATHVERVESEYISKPAFNPDAIRAKSFAAAGLCAWVTNICKYFRIFQASLLYILLLSPLYVTTLIVICFEVCLYASLINIFFEFMQEVAPKRAALADANRKLAEANKKLTGIRARYPKTQKPTLFRLVMLFVMNTNLLYIIIFR